MMNFRYLILLFLTTNMIFGVENKFHPAWKESSGIVGFADLGNGTIASGLENKTIVVWNLNSRKFKVLHSNTSIVSSVAYSSKIGKLAYQSDESKIKILSSDLETVLEIPNSSGSIGSLDFSPDGLRLITGDENGRVRIWDLQGKIRAHFSAHDSSVTTVRFSSDSKRILSAGEDGKTKIWTSEGKLLKELERRSSPILSANFSPDGNSVISGGDDGKIREIRIETGVITDFIGHSSSVRSVVYSQNGKYIVSASEDLSSKIWDLQGRVLATLNGHSDSVNNAIFINSGKQILTASDDGTQKIFDLKGKQLANIVLTDRGKIVFDPKGLFDYDSESLETYFYFNSDDADLNPTLDSFYSLFFSPGLVQKILLGSRESGPSISDIYNTSPPPILEIDLDSTQSKGTTVSIRVKVCDQGGGMGDLYLYHNDSLIRSEDSRSIRVVTTDNCLRKSYLADLSPGENYFRASSASKGGILGYSKSVFQYSHVSKTELPKLHLVLLAVNDYEGENMDLKYAVKDALAIAESQAFRKKNSFSSVRSYTAYNSKADKKGIMSVFEEVGKNSSPEDVLIVFIAGHGAEKDGKFYFLTSGFDSNRPNFSDNAFNQEEFVTSISKIKATRKLLIFDTCDSGGEWTTQFKELGNLAKLAGICVISSTLEKEVAYESSVLEHGILTTALLEGLDGKASTNGKVTAAGLIAYVNLRVPEIAKSVLRKEQYPYSSQRGRDFVISE